MPFHQMSGPNTAWTRVNAAEAVVGVQSPLSLTYWDLGGETGFRLAYVQMGLLPRLHIKYTSDVQAGQIYLPKVNTVLLEFRQGEGPVGEQLCPAVEATGVHRLAHHQHSVLPHAHPDMASGQQQQYQVCSGRLRAGIGRYSPLVCRPGGRG